MSCALGGEWVAAHYCSALLGLMLQQEPIALGGVVATLLVGTPALTLIGGIGAAATVTVRRGGLLMALLMHL